MINQRGYQDGIGQSLNRNCSTGPSAFGVRGLSDGSTSLGHDPCRCGDKQRRQRGAWRRAYDMEIGNRFITFSPPHLSRRAPAQCRLRPRLRHHRGDSSPKSREAKNAARTPWHQETPRSALARSRNSVQSSAVYPPSPVRPSRSVRQVFCDSHGVDLCSPKDTSSWSDQPARLSIPALSGRSCMIFDVAYRQQRAREPGKSRGPRSILAGATSAEPAQQGIQVWNWMQESNFVSTISVSIAP